jgi:D-glycero-D-manno-heptose 1,7-bisphosphate phosphatase
VLNRNVWNPATDQYESPLTPEQFELMPDVLPALRLLSNAGHLLFLVSNQPNYAKGKASMDTLNAIHCRLETALAEANILFAAFYYCFHHPELNGECICRKPSPYFLFQAENTFGIHLAASWMVGDRATDIECGRAAGTRTVEISDLSVPKTKADYAAAGLWSAAQIIMSV